MAFWIKPNSQSAMVGLCWSFSESIKSRRCTADHHLQILPIADVEDDFGSEIVRSFNLASVATGGSILSTNGPTTAANVCRPRLFPDAEGRRPIYHHWRRPVWLQRWAFPSYSVNLLTGRQITRRHAAMDGSVMWEDNRTNTHGVLV